MRIAVLIKQIPRPDQMQIREGRLVRTGVELEVNAYCRRANAKAVELAGDDGEVVALTMGPPSADDALREMIACGATRGVLLTDRAFAGADTLATARVLAAAVIAEGPFDLVLCGLNSLDADTGQVGPELAELLDLPFAAGVRDLTIEGRRFRARTETDTGYRTVEGPLPAVLSTAERLIEPSKAPPEARAGVPADRIRQMSADELSLAPDDVGQPGSPTSVGPVKILESTRQAAITSSVDQALHLLKAFLASRRASASLAGVVPPTGAGPTDIWCFLEPDTARPERELLGEAAALAARVGGQVTAVTASPAPPNLGPQGADRVLVIAGSEPDEWAKALAAAAGRELPWALLVEGTRLGRVIASRVAARHGWGLVGDAVGLDLSDSGRLIAWKPAFGGRLVAPIDSRSPVQIATVRPGVLPSREPREAAEPESVELAPTRPALVVTVAEDVTDVDPLDLLRARAVVGVGMGVTPDSYSLLQPLQDALGGAPLAATRKVTDRGWLPRSRQVGVTGRSIAPDVYVAVGISGKFNHMVGVRNAGFILAINEDPAAPIFENADVGIVADWTAVLAPLANGLAQLQRDLLSTAGGHIAARAP